jgi:hypothetical protein
MPGLVPPPDEPPSPAPGVAPSPDWGGCDPGGEAPDPGVEELDDEHAERRPREARMPRQRNEFEDAIDP